MSNILWEPEDYHYKRSNIAHFISFVNQNYNQSITNYNHLYDWSISYTEDFWESMFNFLKWRNSIRFNRIFKIIR